MPVCPPGPPPPAHSRVPTSRAAPRRRRRVHGSPTRCRSRRSAAGTTPPGSRHPDAPTSSRRDARTRRSPAVTGDAGPGARSPGRSRRGRPRPRLLRLAVRNDPVPTATPRRAGPRPGGRRASRWAAGIPARCGRARCWTRAHAAGPPRGRASASGHHRRPAQPRGATERRLGNGAPGRGRASRQ